MMVEEMGMRLLRTESSENTRGPKAELCVRIDCLQTGKTEH